jgi:sulfite oxidase
LQNRRKFISRSGLALFSYLLGTEIVHGKFMPKEYVPVRFEDLNIDPLSEKAKEMIVLNDRPWNVDAPAHLLDDKVTPASKMFLRNNGLLPTHNTDKDWQLEIAGESVKEPMLISLKELKSKFKHYSYQLVLECGGNGRKRFNPPTKGNQWNYGAVSCALWTGVRLRDVLEYVGLKEDAVYIGYYGKDLHMSGDVSKPVISRGVPMAKAMEDETLLAFQMNGKDIPFVHGYPLRLVVGGWPASVSGKWLDKIVVRNQVHDGPKMEAPSYSVPCKTIAPGSKVKNEEMCMIESMPVKSLITYPKTGGILRDKRKLKVRGHAWAGDYEVKSMEVSIDFGAQWTPCDLAKPVNRLSWQHWECELDFQQTGYYEIWARARDERGQVQPMVSANWNPKGYLNNACHRIALQVI